jgi:hypothetical protein
MMASTNPTPLVVFAVIAMVICGILGMMLGGDPFGPGQAVRAEQARTQMALEVRSTEIAMGALETPQAMYAQQTMEAANLTAMPIRQMATQAAAQAAIEAAEFQATQTAISGDVLNRQLALQATQRALTQGQAIQQADKLISSSAVVLGLLVLAGWVIARTFIQIIHARAQEKTAQAQFLAEQHRMASLRASLQKNNGRKSHRQLPNSLMKKTSDIDKLSKAE